MALVIDCVHEIDALAVGAGLRKRVDPQQAEPSSYAYSGVFSGVFDQVSIEGLAPGQLVQPQILPPPPPRLAELPAHPHPTP